MSARKRGTLKGALEDVKRIRAEDEAAEAAKAAEARAQSDEAIEARAEAAAEEHAERLRRIREEHETSEEKDILALRERQKYYEEQRKHQENRTAAREQKVRSGRHDGRQLGVALFLRHRLAQLSRDSE